MASKNCGQTVYKIYRRTFESYIVAKNITHITSKLHQNGFLTKEEFDTGLTAPTLKVAIREHIESSKGEDKFSLLLDVYESFRDVDVTSIREAFVKGKTLKRRFSIDVPQPGKKPTKAVNKKSDTSNSAPTQRKVFLSLEGKQTKKVSDSSLPPILGSPSIERSKQKETTPLNEANNRTGPSTNQSAEGATVAQETDITHVQYPKPKSDGTFQFEKDSGVYEEIRCIEDLQKEYTDAVDEMSKDTIGQIATAVTTILPKLRSTYEVIATRCTKLEEKVQQYEYTNMVQKEKISADCTQNAELAQKLRQKEEEIKNLTAKVETAKQEAKSIRLRMTQPESGVTFSQQIVKKIHKILSGVQDHSEQVKVVEALHVIQRELLKLRERPATTGGLKTEYH